MSVNRRTLLGSAAGLAAGSLAAGRASARESEAGGSKAGGGAPQALASAGVITPHVGNLPFEMIDGVKQFHLIAGEFNQEFSPGFHVRIWGYNGSSPGPTIEAVEGDRVRILVTNRLTEATTVHWHGMLVPSGMDGVAGISGPSIPPGQTFAYEFTLRQHGSQMYHPHDDEMKQLAMGMMGMFIIHPREPGADAVDRDYVWMTHAWNIPPGTYRPNPATMTDFNIWTLNGRVYPGTAPMLAATGQRVRIRVGNLSMLSHPMHLHGHHFWISGTDGGRIPPERRWSAATVNVAVGTTRDVDFVADNPGDWAYHCHRSHHTMNAMSHTVPNLVGVDERAAGAEIAALVPGYMPMGGHGMAGMEMGPGPVNTAPMMAGRGPYGPVGMGGMFTLLKVRDGLTDFSRDPGWYAPPPGTLPRRV